MLRSIVAVNAAAGSRCIGLALHAGSVHIQPFQPASVRMAVDVLLLNVEAACGGLCTVCRCFLHSWASMWMGGGVGDACNVLPATERAAGASSAAMRLAGSSNLGATLAPRLLLRTWRAPARGLFGARRSAVARAWHCCWQYGSMHSAVATTNAAHCAVGQLCIWLHAQDCRLPCSTQADVYLQRQTYMRAHPAQAVVALVCSLCCQQYIHDHVLAV